MTEHQPSQPRTNPSEEQSPWFYAALGFAIITLFAMCFGFYIVLNGDGLQAKVQRSQMLAPFGIALFALVTFCTVVWRGKISARQLSQQARQLQHQADQLAHQATQVAQQIRQNDANEEANLAKLLQEGAKLMADVKMQSQVLAGIATLEILISEPKKRFAVQAMDLLADYLANTYNDHKMERPVTAAIRALDHGVDLGVYSRVKIDFVIDRDSTWQYHIGAPGLAACTYSGGTVTRSSYILAKKSKAIHVFNNVRLEGLDIETRHRFKGCTFHLCNIATFSGDQIHDNTFISCNFTDAEISKPARHPIQFTAASTRNAFEKGRPPKCEQEFRWNSVMSELP